MSTGTRTGPRRYCLVAPNPLCTNPRLVKEADALAAAGHEVRVVALAVNARATAVDREIMATRRWRVEYVDTDWDSRAGALRRGGWAIVQRGARKAFDRRLPGAVVRDHAMSRFLRSLAARVASAPADVVIAHNLAALPAAARAARRLGARLGFDIEDLHAGELPDSPEHDGERALVRAVEAHYLPRCDYLTASSPGIADAIVEDYGVRRPTVVLNTFPAEAPVGDGAPWRDRRDGAPSLYWFSQTTGPDRGIEDVIEALGVMTTPAQLYLRGAVAPGYGERVLALAAARGCADRVHFLDLVSPEELVRRSAEHDVGLALEPPNTRNRDLAVTNKLFTYMVAGLAVAATATTGQRAVLAGRDVGAFLYAPGDVQSLAQQLDALLASPERLAEAKRKAREAASREFSWAREAERLVSYLAREPSADLDAPLPSLTIAPA